MKSKLLVLMLIFVLACPFKCFSAGITLQYDSELQAVTLNVETSKLNSKAVVTITKISEDERLSIDDKFYSVTEITRNSEGKFIYTAFLPEDAGSGVYYLTVTIGTEVLTSSFTHINSKNADYAVGLINNSVSDDFSGIIERYYSDLAINISEFNTHKEKLTEVFYKYKESELTVDTFYKIYNKSLILSKMFGADKDAVSNLLSNNYETIEFDAESFELFKEEQKEEIYSRFSKGIYMEKTLPLQYKVWEALSGVNSAQKESLYDYETALFVTYGDIFKLDKTDYDSSNQKDEIIKSMMESTYNSIEEVSAAFKTACEKYPYKIHKTEGGLSGGGGGGSYVASGKDKNKEETGKGSSEEKNDKLVFLDVSDSHWAYPMIKALYNDGIVAGDGGGRFLPEKSVTRGEFSKLISVAFYAGNKADAGFSDVNKDDWYYPYIAVLSEKEIVTGAGNNLFFPQQSITRQDMAVIIKRVADNKKVRFEKKDINFSDEADISEYAKEAVSELASAEILGGMGDGTFKPKEPVTKAQAAKVIYMLSELLR